MEETIQEQITHCQNLRCTSLDIQITGTHTHIYVCAHVHMHIVHTVRTACTHAHIHTLYTTPVQMFLSMYTPLLVS